MFGDVENVGRVMHRENVKFTDRSRRTVAAVVSRPFSHVNMEVVVVMMNGTTVYTMKLHATRLESSPTIESNNGTNSHNNSSASPSLNNTLNNQTATTLTTTCGHLWFVSHVVAHQVTTATATAMSAQAFAPSRYIELDHYTEYELSRGDHPAHFRPLRDFEAESVNIFITSIEH